MIVLPGFKLKEDYSIADLLLFDAVTSTASENETLADWVVMVLIIFGALHLATMVRREPWPQ